MKYYNGDIVKSINDGYFPISTNQKNLIPFGNMIGEVIKVYQKNLYLNPITKKYSKIHILNDVCEVKFETIILGKSFCRLELIKRGREGKLRNILDLE